MSGTFHVGEYEIKNPVLAWLCLWVMIAVILATLPITVPLHFGLRLMGRRGFWFRRKGSLNLNIDTAAFRERAQ